MASHAQVWAFVAYGYITASEIGLRQPISIFGQLTASVLALVGILNIAMLTAMFCGGTELDGTEVWLITQIEQRQRKRRMAKRAARYLQRVFRQHRANRNALEVAAEQAGRGFMSPPLKDVTKAERRFKRLRLNNLNVDVTNIKTVHGAVTRMNARMEVLEALVKDVHSELRRQRLTAAGRSEGLVVSTHSADPHSELHEQSEQAGYPAAAAKARAVELQTYVDEANQGTRQAHGIQ